MKNVFMAFVFLFSSVTVHGTDFPTKDVFLNLQDVFVPETIKAGEKAYVIVNGMFPNSCYRWNRAEVRHIGATEHTVRAVATVVQAMCLMVLIPYSKEIVLGPLPAGVHTLRFINGDDTYFERTLAVQ